MMEVEEVRARWDDLIQDVCLGREIVIIDSGRPCARLVPVVTASGRRRPGGVQGRLEDAFFDDLGLGDLDDG